MTAFVADSSAFGPTLFADEKDASIPGFDDLVSEGLCVVPAHWSLEIANQLLVGLRRHRTTELLSQELLTQIYDLPISTDPETADQMFATYVLAMAHGLTVYDAAYLELAKRIGGTLITFDKKLRQAAAEHEIVLIP